MDILGAPPAGIGRLIELHGRWYARHWGLGPGFEAQVAEGLGDFARHLPHPDSGLWVAVQGGQVMGGIVIDGRAAPDARLRWFILDEPARGGTGRRLLDHALDFCRGRGFASVWLTTFAGLDAARRLYESAGFALEHEAPDTGYGAPVRGQRFRLVLR